MSAGFGTKLREWRRLRGISQLDLSAITGVSQRHLSFLETGRSNPSREMVIHLGATLDIPLRERNQLLLHAGLAPEYASTPLGELGQIAESLQFMVDAHSPYMAIVVDRLWNILIANQQATSVMQRLLGDRVDWAGSPPNAMRMVFHPRGLRQHLVNFPEVARELLRWIHRDAAIYPNDEPLRELAAELRELAGPELVTNGDHGGDGLLLPLRYSVGGRTIELFSTIGTIGAPLDVTLEELRIETFWPADVDSDQAWRALVGQQESDSPGGTR